ncbi:MAG TPA: phage holin family protein [Flavobacteriia bacterium]|nr:phage holin family protein [Flavobacteriia bacterium]
MKTILKVLLTALAVIAIAYLLPGVMVKDYTTAIIVAIVLGLLRVFVKPILVFLTIPITIITFGLFLFCINAIIVLLASNLVDGFSVNGVFTALLFSLLLSFFQSILYSFLEDSE